MKSKLFRSFRAEIIMDTLLALLYTLFTEIGIALILHVLKTLLFSLQNTGNRMNTQNFFQTFLNNLFSVPTISNIYEKYYQSSNGNSFMENNIKNPDFYVKDGSQFFPYKILIWLLFGIILGVILFVFYFLLLTKRFTFYMHEMIDKINCFSTGDLEARIPIRREDEFAEIAAGLNRMACELQKKMDEERRGETEKSELITSVAHDLRTPLTSIIGYLDLVLNSEQIEENVKQKYVFIAYEKSRRLEKLIEDLFSYTKYNSGSITMNLSKIDMVKFMEQLIEEFYPSFQEFQLEYMFYTKEKSAIVEADGDLLARAFANLIENAVKYGKDGKRLVVELDVIKGKKQVRIAIINYGKIIPKKDLNYIFKRFYRVENSRSSLTGGTGLGLAIAKNIIEMHQGHISVNSDMNGTIFEVFLNMVAKEQK